MSEETSSSPILCSAAVSGNNHDDRQHCETCDTVKKQITSSTSFPSAPSSLSLLLPKTVESESQTDSIVIPLPDGPNNNKNNCGNSTNTVDQVLEVARGNDQHHSSVSSCTTMLTAQQLPEPVNNNNDVLVDITDDQQPDQMEISTKYFEDPEMSLIQIHEKLIDRGDIETLPSLVDSESEEDDQLKPLMVDNHQECYMSKRQLEKIIKHAEVNDILSPTDSERSFSYVQNRHHQPRQEPFFLMDHGFESSDLQSSDETTKDLDLGGEHEEIKEIDTLSPDEIPDDRMAEEIVEQVEFYFSNDNILKDAFLLKHVRRNKEGFVSLKLVSSFKRVRQLTKDWRVVGNAVRRKSRNIELNDLATKVRRVDPLPTFDETMPSRTIVACDLPVDKLSIERVSDIFSKCGEIALIRILRPGATIPVDVRQFMNKYPEMQQKDCALVEFVESQAARNAQLMTGHYKVFEMVAPKKKTGKKAAVTTMTKLIENYKYNENNYERNRGGVMIPIENDYKFKLRRNNSEYYVKPEQAHMCTQRKYSYSLNNSHNVGSAENNNNFMHYPRRTSNFSVTSSENMSRKYSSCSEGYSSCSELSRRPSTCSSSEQSRRASNCSEHCPCSRRGSQCSGSNNNNYNNNNDLMYRRVSQCSEHTNNVRKYSNGSIPYDRTYSNPPEMTRRISFESNYDRKLSTGSMGSDRVVYTEPCRKYSNGGFDPNRKLSGNTDQYYNGRRLSTDSGYDRKMSFGSDYSSSPRSRSNSFLTCPHKNTEAVVRTPIGPDGSKGFSSRARKVGQIIAPV